jgi:hypothetical protein
MQNERAGNILGGAIHSFSIPWHIYSRSHDRYIGYVPCITNYGDLKNYIRPNREIKKWGVLFGDERYIKKPMRFRRPVKISS